MADETQPGIDDGDDILSEAQLTDLFHHDPMEVVEEASGDEATEQPAEEAQTPAPTVPAVAAATPVPATPPAGPMQSPPPNGLPTQQTDLPRQIAEAVRDAVRPVPQTQAETDSIPPYMFAIPQQLQQMMESEDPSKRAQGYSYLMAGALRAGHQSIREEFQAEMQKLRTELPNAITSAHSVRDTQRQVFDDFYGAHPDLKIPQLGSFIYQQAMALSQEQPGLFIGGWNQQARDAVAMRVRQILGKTAPVAQKPIGRKPPQMLNGGARPAIENLTGQDKLLADIFG